MYGETGGMLVPGTTDIGNHCDDCSTQIAFPFPVQFYNSTYTTAWPSSNGSVSFDGPHNGLGAACPYPSLSFGATIFAYQNDLTTTTSGDGIFTATTGTAPNRQFVIEWRTHYFSPSTSTADFEVILHEASPGFILQYGASTDSGATSGVGVQQSQTGLNSNYSCSTPAEPSGTQVDVEPSHSLPITRLYDNGSSQPSGAPGTGSQEFGGSLASDDDQAADDFVVPAQPGTAGWRVSWIYADGTYAGSTGPASAANVYIYTDSGGLPGSLVFSQPGVIPTRRGTDGAQFGLFLYPAAYLRPGHYWVSVQAVQDFATQGQWYWYDQVQSGSAAAWQNPGGGFGIGCTTWVHRTTCVGDAANPDQAFNLSGQTILASY